MKKYHQFFAIALSTTTTDALLLQKTSWPRDVQYGFEDFSTRVDRFFNPKNDLERWFEDAGTWISRKADNFEDSSNGRGSSSSNRYHARNYDGDDCECCSVFSGAKSYHPPRQRPPHRFYLGEAERNPQTEKDEYALTIMREGACRVYRKVRYSHLYEFARKQQGDVWNNFPYKIILDFLDLI